MISKVLNTLKTHSMLHRGDMVIVALSGGADSVCLLDVLLRLKDEAGISVSAAHINHNLRGDESDRDEEFVRSICKKADVPLYFRSVDVKALSDKSGEGFEAVGRRVRYEFFDELSKEHNALIATAHTLSDVVETALMNMARGASFTGLGSIPYKRGVIIRPLLDVTRGEVEAYVAERALEYVDDSTNFDADICNRNKVRHKVIPVLKDINDAFEQNYLRLKQSVAEADDFINAEAHKLLSSARSEYGYDVKVLADAHKAVLNYALKLLIEQKGAGYDNRHIELIKAGFDKGCAVDLVGGYTVVIKQGILRIIRDNQKEQFELAINNLKDIKFGGKIYSFEELTEEEIKNRKLTSKVVSLDKISKNSIFRTRQQGDRFSLVNRGLSKDLRKLQNEYKIPSELRDMLIVLEDDGKILWAEGIGVSADGSYSDGKGLFIEIKEDVQNA